MPRPRKACGGPALHAPTTFHATTKFRALPGYELLERFRYPVWQAQPIQPSEGVRLEGSSGNFISPREGNVRVPLGRLKPGLSLVEASIGEHRAVTLLFVSDTVAITKLAADASLSAANRPPSRHDYNERAVKVLERPRRDDTDTAAWLPALVTDAQGQARFSFRMPDALSRWRITVRATGLAAADGVPGQRTAFVRSDKALYAKWTSPHWLRQGDRPQAAVALFNNGEGPREVDVSLALSGQTLSHHASLPRGVSYLHFPLPPLAGPTLARLDVRADGQTVDSLELPADARALSIAQTTTGSAQFLHIAQDLLDQPYGCVEQTSSRLIPLALATQVLGDGPRGAQLRQQLYAQRQRLAALAGPGAVFGWWGPGTHDSALMSAYAYYADWNAAQLPPLQPVGDWQPGTGSLGAPPWSWQGATPPAAIELAAPPAPDSALVLRYTSAEAEDGRLDATLTRHLYRLEAKDGRFAKHEVMPGDTLSADALYLDEIQVDAPRPLHYAFVEAPGGRPAAASSSSRPTPGAPRPACG